MTDQTQAIKTDDDELKAKIGGLVRRLRVEQGLSQEDLADESGMHTNMISFIERGIKMPTAGALRRIALALGVRVSEFLEKIGE